MYNCAFVGKPNSRNKVGISLHFKTLHRWGDLKRSKKGNKDAQTFVKGKFILNANKIIYKATHFESLKYTIKRIVEVNLTQLKKRNR